MTNVSLKDSCSGELTR